MESSSRSPTSRFPKKIASEESPFSRVAPHSREAEEAIIGGILLDNEAILAAVEKLRSEDFYDPRLQEIFKAMTSLSDRREPIDLVTVSQRVKQQTGGEHQASQEELVRIAQATPTAANVGYYSQMVKDLAIRRNLIRSANDIINEAFAVTGELDDFMDSVEQKILSVSDRRVAQGFTRIGDIVQESIQIVETLYERKEPVTGIPTGLTQLDLMTAGFQPSDLIIIAARPSMGKTALALSIGSHVSIAKDKAVGVFSLEMSKEQLVLRLLCAEAGVDNSRVRNGRLQDRDFPNLVQAASRLTEAPLFIDDTPAVTVTELRAKCRRLHREHPLSLIIVDYLQLMRSPVYQKSREQEIADISRSLKALAKELQVPVIALSQLNRSVESRPDKRPAMSDLRESGAIEQDADIIMFIYRDEVYNKESTEPGIAELIISKQRNGPIGVVKTRFIAELTLFQDLPQDFSYDLSAGFEAAPYPIAGQSLDSLPIPSIQELPTMGSPYGDDDPFADPF